MEEWRSLALQGLCRAEKAGADLQPPLARGKEGGGEDVDVNLFACYFDSIGKGN